MKEDSAADLSIDAIEKLLEKEDPSMQTLFKRTLGLYVSNGAKPTTDDQKLEFLKKAIEETIQ